MLKLILLIILALFIVGIYAMNRDLSKENIKVCKKTHTENSQTPVLQEIYERASAAFDLVESGEIKREVLLNEAEPYNSVKSVSSFIGTLSNPMLVGFISALKEVNYHE